MAAYLRAAYFLHTGANEAAVGVVEQALVWASKNLLMEENRRDYAQMCVQLSEVVQEPALAERVKRLVKRCLEERLSEPPALSKDNKVFGRTPPELARPLIRAAF